MLNKLVMKTIKSALIGAKTVPDEHFEEELRRVLREHRAVILTQLINDLSTYLDYKFQVKPAKSVFDVIKDRLASLKESFVSLDHYKNTLAMVSTRQLSVLSSEEFYHEIDSEIRLHIKVPQAEPVA